MEDNLEKIICTVDIREGMFDNDFTFYEDGRIKRYYDKNSFNYDNTDWVSSNQIRESHKTKILERLEGKLLEKIKAILYPPNN
jgi:hypothetical protein